MTIFLPKIGIAYFAIPKVAYSSIKHLLYQMETGKEFAREDWNGKHIHQYYNRDRGFAYEYREGDYERSADLWSFAIVRDPIKRILSAFSNRVEHHDDLGYRRWRRRLSVLIGRSEPKPDLNTFCRDIHKWRQTRIIRDHTDPQPIFLGPELAKIKQVFPIERTNEAHAALVKQTGIDIPLKRYQTGGKKYTVDDLNDEAFETLMKFTAPDYEYLKDYYQPPERSG